MKRLTCLLTFLSTIGAPAIATAFCGFYVAGGDADLFNDATQVVLMRENDTTVLSMQNNYEGPTEDFAMVVPVPQVLQKENVKTLEKVVFDRVDQLSAPRLVEYWERDPCQPAALPGVRARGGFGGLGRGASGFGRGGGGVVTVEAEFKVGEYDIVILSTNDSTALNDWLKTNEYSIPDGAEPYFRPYVEGGMYFFVAKVDAEKVKYEDGEAVLSPLRFHYESEQFALPVRLGMINSKGKQDLLVYILANQQRYELANYPNVTIPTNIEVSPRVRDDFASFYESLFDRAIEENPRAVVTEYSWSATKCDPCPTGILGGAGLTQADLQTLGNDVLEVRTQGWNSPGWTLTRLHARYAPDELGEDLVFQKAEPIVGGREVRDGDGSLEKGVTDSAAANNFQGRYIVRHEWEGEVACDVPQHGNWGPPPDAHGMRLVAETVIAELRRGETGELPDAAELAKPWTERERKVVGYHLRERFGTSVAPASARGGPTSAPSANTRGAGSAVRADLALASAVREPIPELNLQPEPEENSRADAPGDPATPANAIVGDGLKQKAADEEKPPNKVGCSAAGGAPGGALFWPVLLAGAAMLRRRRRSVEK